MEATNNKPVVGQQQPQGGMVASSTLKGMLNAESTKKRFSELLGKKATGFISSVLSLHNNSALLKQADPMSVMNAAVIAATLDLPINPNLGFAAIVPYKNKGQMQGQFQLMYKGLIELCMRSGQFLSIIDEVVYDGQLITKNKFTGEYAFDEDAKKSEKVIGYMAYFKLLNGFSKTLYMTIDEVEQHAQKYSQSYKIDKAKGWNSSIWSSNFDVMARKTCLKLLLAKYAPKSIEIQQAVLADQAVVGGDLTQSSANIEDAQFTYVDNDIDKAEEVAAEISAQANGEELDMQTGEIFQPSPEPAKGQKQPDQATQEMAF